MWLTHIIYQSPASYFPQPSHVRKRHRVAPALTPEFASHYADRELRISEVTENLKRVADDNRKLLEDESGLRNKYNDVIIAIWIFYRQVFLWDYINVDVAGTWGTRFDGKPGKWDHKKFKGSLLNVLSTQAMVQRQPTWPQVRNTKSITRCFQDVSNISHFSARTMNSDL